MTHSPEASALTLPVHTRARQEFLNITERIGALVPNGFNGICNLFSTHTTAGLTINENADPDVVHDLLLELDRLVPSANPRFRHAEGNSAAHLKASLMGASLTVPVVAGRLALGVWQGIYFCEFDGPRSRTVLVQFAAASGRPAPQGATA